ncbi:MAG: corrinoid protein [Dehalococcoidia bacterium]|nr:corrinoid protein [Dehalococcoidia bacterium]
MSDFKELSEAVNKGDAKTALVEAQKALDAGNSAEDILNKGLITAMNEVGDKFSKGLLFVPQMLRAAKTMQECTKLLQPFFQEGDVTSKGKVLIGTVKGDLHDIGKNLVSMMLEGSGFTITDVGVDVSPEKFVEKTREVKPDIIALSALLSTTMPAMAQTIDALQKAGLRDKAKVMIGGAPVTEKYAQQINADSYAPDAGSAVNKAKALLGIS